MNRLAVACALGLSIALTLTWSCARHGRQDESTAVDSLPEPKAPTDVPTSESNHDTSVAEIQPRVAFPNEPLTELDLLDAETERQYANFLWRDADPPPPGAVVALTSDQFWHQAPVQSLQFTADSQELGAITSEAFYRWNVMTGELLRKSKWQDFTPFSYAAISADLSTIAAIGITGSKIYVADTATGRLLYMLKDVPGPIRHLSFSADGNLLVTSDGKSVLLWNRSDGTLLKNIHAEHTIDQVFVGNEVRAITSSEAGSIRFTRWDAHTFELLSERVIELTLDRPRFSDDGRWVIGWIEPSAVRAFDFHKGHPVFPEAFILDRNQRIAEVWNLKDGSSLRQFKLGFGPECLSPDGKHLVAVQGQQAQVWDVATGQRLTEPCLRTYLRPVVAKIAVEDLFRVAVHWAVAEGDDSALDGPPHVPWPFDEELSTAASLESLTFHLRAPSGREYALQAKVVAESDPNAHWPTQVRLLDHPTFVFQLNKDGFTTANQHQRFSGRWLNGEQPALREFGTYSVSISGRIVFTQADAIRFQTAECTLQRGNVTPLAQVRAIAEAKLRQLVPANARGKIREWDRFRDGLGLPGIYENAKGERCTVWSVYKPEWQEDVYLVTVLPDGSPLRVETWGRFTCVARGTLINGPAGAKAVEELRVGDTVWGFDVTKGTLLPTTVRAISTAIAHETLVMRGSLRITPNHPMFASGTWKPAGDVNPDDRLLDLLDRAVPAGVSIRCEGAVTVYDLTVDAPHTFFADGLLVHNKSVAYAPGAFDPWRVFHFKPPEESRLLWSAPSR